VDLNHRPLGYEPNELPDCSTPQFDDSNRDPGRQTSFERIDAMLIGSVSLIARQGFQKSPYRITDCGIQKHVPDTAVLIPGGFSMPKKEVQTSQSRINAQPRVHQRAAEIQPYGTVSHALPLDLEESVRLEMTEQLNQLLADSMTLRDLYKKSHWQVAGPTFYQLHLLFDKHFEEQVEVVDTIAERIQLLGGISIAMAHDVAETTRIERPPRGREEVPVQISRLIDAHQVIIGECREIAKKADELGDDGSNDMVISDVLRVNELQSWFITEHLVEMPLVHAVDPSMRKVG
jgi:starvation-inducible DNA-binding protein